MTIQNNQTVRWLVAAASCLIVAIAGFYWADSMMALRNEMTEVDDLRSQQVRLKQTAANLQHSDESIERELTSLSDSAVTVDELSMFRQELVDIVRHENCQLRQIRVEPGARRRWQGPNDTPFAEKSNEQEGFTSLMLNAGQVEIKATGTLEDIRGLIRSVHRRGWLSHSERWELRPIDQAGKSIELNYKLSVYGLAPQTEAEANADDMT